MSSPKIPSDLRNTDCDIGENDASMLVGNSSVLVEQGAENPEARQQAIGSWKEIEPDNEVDGPNSLDDAHPTELPMSVAFGHLNQLISVNDRDESHSQIEQPADETRAIPVMPVSENIRSSGYSQRQKDENVERGTKSERNYRYSVFPLERRENRLPEEVTRALAKLGEPDYSKIFPEPKPENIRLPSSPSGSVSGRMSITSADMSFCIPEIEQPEPFHTLVMEAIGNGYNVDALEFESEADTREQNNEEPRVDEPIQKSIRSEEGDQRERCGYDVNESVDGFRPSLELEGVEQRNSYQRRIPTIKIDSVPESSASSLRNMENPLQSLVPTNIFRAATASSSLAPLQTSFKTTSSSLLPPPMEAYQRFGSTSSLDANGYEENETPKESYCDALRRQAEQIPDLEPPKKTGIIQTLKRFGSRVSLRSVSPSVPARTSSLQTTLDTSFRPSNTFSPPSPKPTIVERTLAAKNSFPMLARHKTPPEDMELTPPKPRSVYSTAEPLRADQPLCTTKRSPRQESRRPALPAMPSSEDRLRALLERYPPPPGVQPPLGPHRQTVHFSRQTPAYAGSPQSSSQAPPRRPTRERPPMPGSSREPPIPVRMGHINNPLCPDGPPPRPAWAVDAGLAAEEPGVYRMAPSVPQDLVYYYNWHQGQGRTTRVTQYIYSLGIINGERARYMQAGDRCWEIARQAMYAEIEEMGLGPILLDGRLWSDHYQPGVTQPAQSPDTYHELLDNARANT